jgi:hypothetical protein
LQHSSSEDASKPIKTKNNLSLFLGLKEKNAFGEMAERALTVKLKAVAAYSNGFGFFLS